MTISRRDLLSGAAAVLATNRSASSALITLERNRPARRGGFLPLHMLPEHARAAVLRRRRWLEQREEKRARLAWGAANNVPGDLFRYMKLTWAHCNPFYEWPDWWAEQSDRLRWIHEQYGRPYRDWVKEERRTGPVIPLDFADELHARGLLGQLIMFSGPRVNGTNDGGGGAVAGAYYIGGTGASDANDGMLTSEGGTGPWATYDKWLSEAALGTFSVGDQVYFRGGTYVPTTSGQPDNGSTVAGASKVVVESYPGERAIWAFTNANDDVVLASALGNDGAIRLISPNWRFKSLDLRNEVYCWGTNIATPAPGSEFIDIKRRWLGNKTASENAGSCKMQNGCEDLLIEAWETEDGFHTTGTNANHAELYTINIDAYVVRGCILKWQGTGDDFHQKRNLGTTDHTYENNFTYHYSNGIGHKAVNEMNATWANCVHGAPNTSRIAYFSDGGSLDPEGRGCVFDHCTVGRTSTIAGEGMQMGPNAQSHTRLGTEGENGQITNSICEDQFRWMFSGTYGTPYTFNGNSDYNHFNSSTAYPAKHGDGTGGGREFASLAAFAAETADFGGAHDANSIENAQSWGTKSLTDVTTWGVSNTGTGNDMTPMGADLSLVGPAPLGY